MSYTLLAHLFPRIKGSQEDIATFSLSYILERSSVMNGAFTKIISRKLHTDLPKTVTYRCQDADSEYGRPDIAGYNEGALTILCEAKFFSALTENQPESYIKRLQDTTGKGLVFICPRQRKVSLWDSLLNRMGEKNGILVSEQCIDYNGVRMAIVSWNEILEELTLISSEKASEMIGDLHQLKGFCEKVENEAFIPFSPEDFSPRIARDIDRYYEVIDEVHKLLLSRKELGPSARGLRKSPRWQGYSRYIRFNDLAISIDHIRTLWKSPLSIETPFWCSISEIVDGKWVGTESVLKYLSSIDDRLRDDFLGNPYIALLPKPYVSLEEVAEDICGQIIRLVKGFSKSK